MPPPSWYRAHIFHITRSEGSGSSQAEKVLVDTPDNIWKMTKGKSGISHKFFMDYFAGKKYAVAYELEDIEKFPEPKPLMAFGLGYIPQSFAYISK